ncbi:VOC family protein [Larkinella sp. VNQ87]|uniref:VOC family protein n=1 Tax=Larkinella sp. VNQ87 TaxID=3400921 RepID=UPI003BFF57B8
MPTITTFLTFNNQAEEAATLYTSVFNNSKITNISRYGQGGPAPEGSVMSVSFVLDGQPFSALNGGPHFTFSEGISLFVHCETQEEVDLYWEKLTADGGKPGPCGWLKDRFGVSWQIIPAQLGRLLQDKDPEKAGRVMQAMLKMTRIDIATLEQAVEEAVSA